MDQVSLPDDFVAFPAFPRPLLRGWRLRPPHLRGTETAIAWSRG